MCEESVHHSTRNTFRNINRTEGHKDEGNETGTNQKKKKGQKNDQGCEINYKQKRTNKKQ
jgi:hypothetical protein